MTKDQFNQTGWQRILEESNNNGGYVCCQLISKKGESLIYYGVIPVITYANEDYFIKFKWRIKK